MIFERVKSQGLAAFSYFVGSQKDAVVVDARRDCQVYCDIAKREDMKIKYVFETHRNEDFVIGSCELAKITGAKVFHGPGLDYKYGETLEDGTNFCFGKMKLKTIHTPGHTDESVSYALFDSSLGKSPIMVFSGDTLFAGDVGRVDLYGPKETPRLAKSLYDSVFEKIMPLGDGVILCPAHGRGSICGGAISDREWSTLGIERLTNPAIQKTRKEFIRFKIAERLERPPYFKKMEQYNLDGPPLLNGLPQPPSLSPSEFNTKIKQGALVVDVRSPCAFGGAHIKDSISIWLGGLAVYAGWVIPYSKPVVLVLENTQQLATAISYLVRLGIDKIGGYLCAGAKSCGLESWYSKALPTSHIDLLTVQELREMLDQKNNLILVDVRSDKEWNKGHIKDALHIHVGHLREQLNIIPTGRPIVAICRVGNRGSLGASILRKEGRKIVYNVLGGMTAWRKAGYPIVNQKEEIKVVPYVVFDV